ncbi:MAG TPA: hypothetical protein VMW87_14145 [Spirochaetia bacterium]|nr:hypothetical protein [Spirochaetia bacterium]
MNPTGKSVYVVKVNSASGYSIIANGIDVGALAPAAESLFHTGKNPWSVAAAVVTAPQSLKII